MKKLLLSSVIAAALALSGCGGETLKDVQQSTQPAKAFTRVVFDPGADQPKLNIPNDLLMVPKGNLFDFTINILPDDKVDPSDPQYALGALDGWSTQQPFQINFDLAPGVEIDGDSAASGNAIMLFESQQALEGQSATCQAVAAQLPAPGVPCELGTQLQYGVDYIVQKSAPGTVNVVPLKPLKPGQGYMLVVTDALKDSMGRSVKGSTTWELVRQDPQTHPLASADQKQLQAIVNQFIQLLGGDGLTRNQISYAAYFSTQSAGTVLSTVKQLDIAPFAKAYATAMAQTAGDTVASQQAAAAYLHKLTIDNAAAPDVFTVLKSKLLDSATLTALTNLSLDSCSSLMAGLSSGDSTVAATAQQVFPKVAGYCAANLKQGTIDLPYFLSTSKPLTDWWRAACTNGAMLKSLGADKVTALIQAGAVGPNEALCQQASGGKLHDLDLSSLGIDDPRNLTKVDPIPVARGRNSDGTETLKVQITVPNQTVLNTIAALNGTTPITEPASGWPVVILQHGITSKKEDMLAITGALSAAGFATVAIDDPMHGSRGMMADKNGDGTPDVVNASTGFGGAPTDYLNLASLLTARDNLRQTIVDILGLRLGLNVTIDNTGSAKLDGTNVSFIGHSLGAIAGTAAVALANNTLGGDLANFDGMFHIKAATLANPGGAVGDFLFDSVAFGNLVKGSLLAASSDDFKTALAQYMQAKSYPQATGDVLAEFFPIFYGQLTDAQKATVDDTFKSFAFAAQTVIDAADPNNYAAMIGANTPVHMIEVVGDGTDANPSDQVIPNQGSLPLAGTDPLANLMGLEQIVSTTQGSGVVKFNAGTHSSILDPTSSLAVTTEMQKEAATFMATQGSTIMISDPAVVSTN